MTPYRGTPVSREEGWQFIKAVLAAFPGTIWTVFDGQGREVANNRLPVAP